MESDSPLPNLLLRQRGRRFRQIAAIDVALMVVLGLVNLVRNNTAQGGLLLGAAAATCGLLWWHARRPGTAAPFVFTLLGIVVVGAVTWMGHGLLDVGNYAFPGIVALASLLLNRAQFRACVGLVLGILCFTGVAEFSGWHQWEARPVEPWDLLDMAMITLASAAVASLIVAETRRGVHALEVQQDAMQQASARLAASEERFRGLFETAPLGLARLDERMCIVDANGKLADMVGIDRAAMHGLRPEQLCHPEDWPALQQALTQQCDKDQAVVELRLRVVKGTPIDVRINLNRRDIGGGAMLSVEDVTQMRAIHELQRAKAAAEAATQAQTDFLSRMSHELRTPLNAMLGYTQLMRANAAQSGDDAPLLHRLQVVESAGWHLAAMINDILDLSRLQAGNLPLRLAATRLAPLLEEALALQADDAGRLGIRLEPPSLPAEDLWVLADATRLRQILANLLSNAVKFSRPGGWVRVTAHQDSPDGLVAIEVEDNGLGLSEDQQARLYEPFNRLGREASGPAGTGIGLVITRSLVELLGGDLQVISQEHKGSRFIVRLAASPPGASVAEVEQVPPPALPDYGPRRVIYIEDNPVNAEIMQAILQARPQIHLELHADGRLGLEAVLSAPPDLLLLDLQLGELDGLAILSALRNDASTAGLDVLVVSADVLPATLSAALAAGAQGFIAKPLDIASTLRAIDMMLVD